MEGRKHRGWYIRMAIDAYASLSAGEVSALAQVPYIRDQLKAANITAEVLDATGKRSAEEVERQLDELYASAEHVRDSFWRKLAQQESDSKARGRSGDNL